MQQTKRRWEDGQPTENKARCERTESTAPAFDSCQPDDALKKKLTLADLPPDAPSIPWAEWKARALNRVFKEHSGIPGRFAAKDIRDAEANEKAWLAKRDAAKPDA